MSSPATASSASATTPHAACDIRDARDADLPAIHAIYAHQVLHSVASFEEVPPSLDEMRARRAAVLGHGLPWLVASVEGRLAGYAYAGPYRPRAAYRHTVEDSIYLDEAFRGRGIGRALLAELIARCERGPWRQMIAVIADGGRGGSTSLHAAFGFAPAGTLAAVGYKHGRWLDIALMQRALGPGADAPPARGDAGPHTG